MQIGNEFLVFKYPVNCKKNLKFLKIFIEIKVNFCLLYAHHVSKGLVLHTRDLTVNKMPVTRFVWFRLIFFSHFEEMKKNVFHIVQFCPTRYLLKIFRCL